MFPILTTPSCLCALDPHHTWGVRGRVGLHRTRVDRVHTRCKEQPGAEPGSGLGFTWRTGERLSAMHCAALIDLVHPLRNRSDLISLFIYFKDFLPCAERNTSRWRAECVVLEPAGPVLRHPDHSHSHSRRKRYVTRWSLEHDAPCLESLWLNEQKIACSSFLGYFCWFLKALKDA